jgi:hypothetical protein
MKAHPKLIASAITAALLAGAVHAAENAGGGQPTSTPTHTVPAKPTDRLTIKTKSSPPYAPPIEDEKKTSTTTTTNAGKPVTRPTATRVGKCPMGEIWVQGPGDPHGHCERKPIPKD